MRKLVYTAKLNSTIEDNLRNEGFSASIITELRKELGLIQNLSTNKILRTIDNINIGEKYQIILKDNITRHIPKYDFPLNIVYQDEDLIIINKPQDLAVISTNIHYAKSLENALANIFGDFIYRPVNRLDKDTSGLIIIAKNQLAHSLLQAQHITKKYVALVDGKLEGEGIIDAPIYKCDIGSMMRIVDNRGKSAKTKYKSLKVYDDYSLVEFTLFTGRTHQIRVHSAYIGHPLCADFLYNPNYKSIITPSGNTLTKQALHSSYLEFVHPVTKELMSFSIKADFEE